MPDRPDAVDDAARGQAARGGRLGVAGLAAAEASALVEDGGPARAVDRPVDAAAAEQRRVGRVHDCVHFLLGDVTDHEPDAVRGGHVPAVYRLTPTRAGRG